VIDKCDGAVRRIHSAYEVYVPWNFKRAILPGKRNRFVSILKQVHQLTKDTGEVAAIDLVNDEHAW
jgi:hypothetical protein